MSDRSDVLYLFNAGDKVWMILSCGHWYAWQGPHPPAVGTRFLCPDCRPLPDVQRLTTPSMCAFCHYVMHPAHNAQPLAPVEHCGDCHREFLHAREALAEIRETLETLIASPPYPQRLRDNLRELWWKTEPPARVETPAVCTVTIPGFRCTRYEGHTGPHAAVPVMDARD